MVDRQPVRIRGMFGTIAPRYDLLNRLLSFSVDRYWRWRTWRHLSPHLRPTEWALDLCSGTGDLSLLLSRGAPVVSCDFSHPMLLLAEEKVRRKAREKAIRQVEGDALQLPFPPSVFQAVTIAFGLRNLADHRRGLEEAFRVLRPGGRLAVLEFSQPTLPLFRGLYAFYLNHLLPRLGDWISGGSGAYRYLSESVREFPEKEILAEWIREAGFREVRYYSWTGGIVALHTGVRPLDGELED